MQWNPMPEPTFWNMDLWLVAGLLLYAWVVQRHFRQISILFQALFDFRNFDKPVRASFREGNMPSAWVNGLFFCVSFTVYAWWGWVVNYREVFPALPVLGGRPWEAWTRGQVLMVLCLALAGCWYAVKYFVLRFVGFVFDEMRFSSFAWKTGLYYDFSFSLICLPLLALCLRLDGLLLKALIVVSLVLYCICFVIKMLRFVIEGKEYSRFSPLHIFVYLCALEILPFVCFWRIFSSL